MSDDGTPILERTIAILSREFGDPVCRGDCCWWTLSRDRRQPVRLSVFLDSDPDRAQGWLCDLQNPEWTTYKFTITSESQVPPLLARVRDLVAQQPEAAVIYSPDARSESGH